MSNRNQNFYNLNSVRSYPLDDRATRIGDNGERLPNNIIVDASVRFPAHLGEYAYVSSLAVTKTLVTATLLACPDIDSSSATFTPLAAVTARKPLQSGRHYALDALYPGVGGWIVFGDVDEEFSVRFSTPRQSLLLPRCARPYRKLPVETVRKLGVASSLTGVVTIKGGSDIEVVADERRIDGVNRKVIVVRLNSFSGRRNVLDVYKGPCGQRPESENCDKPGVEFLNTVRPDCNGNIDIVFTGDVEVTPYEGKRGGLILDHPLGLTEACTKNDRLPDRQGRLPNEYDDNCTSEYEGQYDEDDTNTVGEEPPIHNVPTVSSEVLDCPDLPYLERFDDADAENWRVLSGNWGFTAADSPGQPEYDRVSVIRRKDYILYQWKNYRFTRSKPKTVSYLWVRNGSSGSSESLSHLFISSQSSSEVQTTSQSSSIVSSAPLPNPYSYHAHGLQRRNVSIWDTCAHDNTLNKRVRVDLSLLSSGPKINGGVVLNYHTVGTSVQHDEYMVAEIDQPSDSLRLRLWGGTSFFTLSSVSGLGLKIGHWYRIEAEITPGANPAVQTRVKVTLTGITDPTVTASFTTITTRYLPANGRFGLATDQASTLFSYFFLENI